MKTTNLNELNNTTIENNEILSFEEFKNMSRDDLLHRIKMNQLNARIAMIQFQSQQIQFGLKLDEMNRVLDGFTFSN